MSGAMGGAEVGRGEVDRWDFLLHNAGSRFEDMLFGHAKLVFGFLALAQVAHATSCIIITILLLGLIIAVIIVNISSSNISVHACNKGNIGREPILHTAHLLVSQKSQKYEVVRNLEKLSSQDL